MGTELPPRSRLWVDFRILVEGDDVVASRPLGDNGWGPSVGVRGPVKGRGRMSAGGSSAFENCRNI